MKKIVILTATYNHPNEIYDLYESIEKQNDREFSWIIVDDGSNDVTVKVLNKIEKRISIDFKIIHQKNGGKSAAINTGLDNLTNEVKFVVIVDDDEKLFADAIQVVREYYNTYKNTDCGVVHFNRVNENNEMLANPIIDSDFYMSYQDFKARKRRADGYIGYFADKLGSMRFILNQGEKYVAPSTLFMKVTKISMLLWAKGTLGQTEYLEGGITKQGRKLRIKNPSGMIEYCNLMYEGSNSFVQRIGISIMGYAYLEFCKHSNRNISYKFNRLCKIPGMVLALIWKIKYR